NRELALFYADHNIKLPESLALAERELEVRRDIYTEDVLAWSFYKNRKLKESRIAIERALRLGTNDAMFYYHAALIYRDLGDVTSARELLERALAINSHFHIFYADDARKALQAMSSTPLTAKLGDSSR
ncbi:MAG: hypothetical protein JO356_06195, partial [Acidobacteria bacterium]|nr:hypothetical protein [Acidobacteriota bacterium]